VGDTVTFKAALGPAECLPPGVDPPEWRWYSLDTLIVKIDSLSGLATAVGPGLGPIRVEHARERDFDLSVNTIDDCRSIGGDFVFGEVLHLGTYTREATLLSFTPDREPAPMFTGTIEGDYIRLTLPPATGIASEDVELLVGPRQPY
jgi:hypothetical protein